jgi:hypothetical protein
MNRRTNKYNENIIQETKKNDKLITKLKSTTIWPDKQAHHTPLKIARSKKHEQKLEVTSTT